MNSSDSQQQYSSSNSDTWSRLLIHPVVKAHLKRVHLSQCFGFLSSALGAYLHIRWNFGGAFTTFASLCAMGWALPVPSRETPIQVSMLMISALLQGASYGPIINLAIDFNPSYLVIAYIGTAIAYACFWVAIMLAGRRVYFYLGCFLSSSLSLLLWVHFASSIFGDSRGFNFKLYFGLLVFVGYMVFDTRNIIELAYLGDQMDYVRHAIMIFIDLIVVFVRIPYLLNNQLLLVAKNLWQLMSSHW